MVLGWPSGDGRGGAGATIGAVLVGRSVGRWACNDIVAAAATTHASNAASCSMRVLQDKRRAVYSPSTGCLTHSVGVVRPMTERASEWLAQESPVQSPPRVHAADAAVYTILSLNVSMRSCLLLVCHLAHPHR